jgi:peptide/nickel transport system permease protein
VRYADWLKGLATGELGISTAYDTPITQLIGERLRVTLPLALLGDGADHRARVRRSACSPRRGTAAPATSASWRSSQIGIAIPTSGSRSS